MNLLECSQMDNLNTEYAREELLTKNSLARLLIAFACRKHLRDRQHARDVSCIGFIKEARDGGRMDYEETRAWRDASFSAHLAYNSLSLKNQILG